MDTLRLHESESSLEVDQDIDIEIIPPALAALKKLGKADRRGSARRRSQRHRREFWQE